MIAYMEIHNFINQVLMIVYMKIQDLVKQVPWLPKQSSSTWDKTILYPGIQAVAGTLYYQEQINI